MSIIIHDCPHCVTRNMTFRIFGCYSKVSGNEYMAGIAAECQKCNQPVAGILRHVSSATPAASSNAVHAFGRLMNDPGDAFALGYEVIRLWPELPAPEIAEGLPPAVQRSVQQAEINYFLEGCEEASATMYRRALDTGLKIAYPDVKGDIYKKIEHLVSQKEFPRSIGDWAHEIRLIGNDGAHDVGGVTRLDLMAARAFVDAVLKYSFTLPQMISERRGLAAGEASLTATAMEASPLAS